MSLMMTMLDLDLIGLILMQVRCDRMGNQTIPGLVFEARTWRRVSRYFLDTSRCTPSLYDAVVYYESTGMHIRPFKFMGGVLCSELQKSVLQCRSDDDVLDDGFLQKGRHMFMLRDAHTGRVWAMLTQSMSDIEVKARGEMRSVEINLKISHLVQLLSGQNADFTTRLDHMDRIVAGLSANQALSTAIDDQQSILGETILSRYNCADDRFTNVAGIMDVYVGWGAEKQFQWKRSIKEGMGPSIQISINDGEVTRLLRTSKAWNIENAVSPCLSPVSVMLGFYDDAKVVECDGIQVGIHTHGLPKELMPRLKANDPERHLRILGIAALDRAQRVETETSAVVVRSSRNAMQTGPSATPSRRPRDAAIAARSGIRAGVKADNDTLSTGRFKVVRQMADEESRASEASGYIDDQYAGFGEEKQEPVMYDSDGEYKDRAPKRTRRMMEKERLNEELTRQNDMFMRKFESLDSDDDDDDDVHAEDI